VLPQVLLAHPGTQYSHRLAEQLVRCGLLQEFWTGFAVANDAWSTRLLQKYLPLSWQKKIANRVLIGVPAKAVYETKASSGAHQTAGVAGLPAANLSDG
jgi:hypothetical protein